MRISDAISTVDTLKPNNYTVEDKIAWLSTLDTRVKSQIIDAHQNKDPAYFYGYDDMIDQDTELLVQAPFDEIYLRYLEAMIDYHNSDYDRYNNSIMLFNNAYDGFKRFYTRTHMPVSHGKFVF